MEPPRQPQLYAFSSAFSEVLARAILTIEASSTDTGDLEVALSAHRKLAAMLTQMVGLSGFRALLSRSLAMTTTQFPWLVAMQISVAATVELRIDAEPQDIAPDALAGYAASRALLTNFLDLLATFIGTELTLGIISSIWPDIWQQEDANGSAILGAANSTDARGNTQ